MPNQSPRYGSFIKLDSQATTSSIPYGPLQIDAYEMGWPKSSVCPFLPTSVILTPIPEMGMSLGGASQGAPVG